MRSWIRPLILVALLSLPLACGGGEDESLDPVPVPIDSLSAEEQAQFAVDPTRFPEMQDGRLDTVDMQTQVPTSPEHIAVWHVQAVNYTTEFIAMTYAFGHDGPDSVAYFAADHQPRLVDDLGNVYEGSLIPENPRLETAQGTMSVGVYVFQPTLAAGADSLTLYVNDSTPPVIRVGPWSVYHTPERGGLEVRPGN